MRHSTKLTVPDCTLDGKRIKLTDWRSLSSADLARVVGTQAPGCDIEYAKDYDWDFRYVPTKDLTAANDDGEEPEGGWSRAYRDHCKADAQAVKNGSPEYAGRAEWLKTEWCPNTAIYPLYLVLEPDEDDPRQHRYRLWDGHRRLAGAFHFRVGKIACLVGQPKKKRRN